MGFFLLSHGNSNQIPNLVGAAESYSYLNWSVIPVLGDAKPDSPKQPAVNWKPYQTRRASLEQSKAWFVNTPYTALGIVTGVISRLAVLDFDDAALAEAFAARFSELIQTRTVLSAGRGLPHYYFHIPPTVRTSSKRTNGIDWLYEGRFVIAPPSIINGQHYRFQRGGQPRTLNQADVNRIAAFLQRYETVPKRITRQGPPTYTVSVPTEPQPLTVADLQGWYRHQANPGSRNDTLFRCACEARDSGWSEHQTVAALAELHTRNILTDEDSVSRYREAIRTIHSAFSRPARQPQQYNTLNLPNTITENLLKRSMTDALRVIVALRQQGIGPGQWFTQNEAWGLLQGHVGNYGMRSVLNRILAHNQRLFEVRESYENPSPKNPNPVATATITSTNDISNCVEIKISKPSTNPRGRKTKYYQMRSNVDFARILGVKLTRTSDPLVLVDVRSAKETRKAVHRAYIHRRPGKYPLNWLARRLGMSRITVWRYNHDIPDLKVIPTYIETPLTWHNLNLIPTLELNQGFLLQDAEGKQYPAKKQVAVHLIAQGKRVSLLRRWFNYYYIEGTHDVHLAQHSLPRLSAFTCRVDEGSYPSQSGATSRQKVQNSAISGNLPISIEKDSQQVNKPLKTPESESKGKKSHNPRRRFPYAEDEELVGQLQQRMNRLCEKPGQGISKRTLRRLIVMYGKSTVKDAIKGIEEREYVNENPVGFLVVTLRSNSKHGELKVLLRQARDS